MTDVNKSIGAENRHTFWCDDQEQRRFYRTCMCLKDAYDAGRLKPEDADQKSCANSMQRGTCNAYKMREEELVAGKSLYFTEATVRVIGALKKEVDKDSEGYQRGYAQVGASLGKGDKLPIKDRKHIPIKSAQEKSQDKGLFNTGSVDMAAIISNEVKREKQQSVTADELFRMKKEIVAIAKTDPKRAKELFAQAKKLEQQMTV